MISSAKWFYGLGCIVLFLGLVWMFLPHAFHDEVLSNIGEEHESTHFTHTLQGAIVAIIGLIVLILSNRKMNALSKGKRRVA